MRGNARRLNDILRVRVQVERFVDRLIRTLDRLDAATDELEDPDIDDDDILEPSLGSTDDFDQRQSWRRYDLHTPDGEQEGSCRRSCYARVAVVKNVPADDS